MAHVRIPDQDRTIDEPEAIAAFLAPFGIRYERWDVDGRIGEEATSEEVLAAYAPELERLKREGGYVTADVIDVTPETENLQALLDKFNKEHRHTEDEVRFIVEGRGLFHVNPPGHPVFSIETEKGDLISVPAETRHWFDLCREQRIRAIRLFQDVSGWTPHYEDEGLHDRYIPVCFGASFVEGATPRIDPARI